jgi:hypothetical protein
MAHEPNYRIRVEIYDDEVGEVVTRYDQPMFSRDEDNVEAAWVAVRRFNGDDKTNHEITHYPKESDSDE